MGKKSGEEKQIASYDPAYSKKMADIAERQQQMAEEQWDMYKEHFMNYEVETAKANKELLPYMTNVAKEFFTEAREGIDTSRRMEEAEADVVGAYEKVPQAMRLEASKYGIDPSSARFLSTMKRMGLDEAKAIAGARTGAKERAETESFNRLSTATGRQPLGTTMAQPAERAISGMGMAASTYQPLATRVLQQTRQYDKGNIWDFLMNTGATAAGIYTGAKLAG